MTKKTISIVIPVFNEEANVAHAVSEVEALFKNHLQNYQLEIVVTDNRSTDKTWATIQSLGRTRSFLKAYRFSRNFGYQNSIFAGLFHATGDAVVELDADLEDPPAVILEFVKEWEQGCNVVYGVRRRRYAPWYLKLFFALFYKIMNRISELKIPENTGDFRLLDRAVVNVLKNLPERNLYLRGLVTYLGFRQKPVYYDRQPRVQGVSKFRFFHYIVLAIDAVTSFTKAPLRLIGYLGVFLFFGAVALSVHYLVDYLRHGVPVQGFTTLVILILLLHGITLIFLGVIGEYLSRIFDDSKKRPRVIIEEAVNDDGFNRVI